MRKQLYRILAFALGLLIVLIIAVGLISLLGPRFLNKQGETAQTLAPQTHDAAYPTEAAPPSPKKEISASSSLRGALLSSQPVIAKPKPAAAPVNAPDPTATQLTLQNRMLETLQRNMAQEAEAPQIEAIAQKSKDVAPGRFADEEEFREQRKESAEELQELQINALMGMRVETASRQMPSEDMPTEQADFAEDEEVLTEEDDSAFALDADDRVGNADADFALAEPEPFFDAKPQQVLQFKAAHGYWANTYIPDDPLLRRLHTRLRQNEQDLPVLAQPVWQPFDTPTHAALNLFLHADHAYIQEPQRLLVQVGLKGTSRHSGQRPAMNVGLVVDLRQPLSAPQAERLRALLQAFVKAKQNGDRFCLTLAGQAGGTLLEAEDFRHGPMTLALQQIFGQRRTEGPTYSLDQAMEVASQQVRAQDDPSAALGSSLLILISPGNLDGYFAALEEFAYSSTLAGIPLSAVALDEAQQEQLESLVLAGQGRLYVLQQANAASSLVDKELHAVSRVVARALRLNIRLRPGVKLVDVLGSQALGEQQSQQVRRNEQYVDQRLSKNLGIQMDRGQDDDGIQILIPAFHASNSHVILLDVVAEQAGPIAEVSLKYKDLVYLRNGEARAALVIGERPRNLSPLELNVTKNKLAWQLSDSLRQAGQALSTANLEQAVGFLQMYLDNLASMQQQVADWQNDAELLADKGLVETYLQSLQQPVAQQPHWQQHLSDVFQYNSFNKLLPQPES